MKRHHSYLRQQILMKHQNNQKKKKRKKMRSKNEFNIKEIITRRNQHLKNKPEEYGKINTIEINNAQFEKLINLIIKYDYYL